MYVASVGDRAFYNCDSLKSVVLNAELASLGEESFYDCGSLAGLQTDGNISNVPLTIGASGFQLCKSLGEVSFIGRTEVYLEDSSFYNCSKLTNTIGLSCIKQLGVCSFGNCSNLKTIDLSSVTEIPNSCFSGCSGLEQLPVRIRQCPENPGQKHLGDVLLLCLI